MAVAALAAGAAPARADQTVVDATIYPGAQGSVRTASVTLAQLASCPQPSDVSDPMYLYPGGQPYEWPTGSTWTVSTVVTCGLGLTPDSVTGVQVRSPAQGAEQPLSAADLTDPGQWHDAQAPAALPVIGVNPGDGQVTYFRPYRGGSDENARDQVVQDGAPVDVLVYESGSMLSVTAAQQSAGHPAHAVSETFSAAVRGADGTPVPPAQLQWSWSFGDGATSAAAAPSHSFAAGVDYYVTVQVTDPATGAGGADTIVVHAATPAPGSANRTGAGGPSKSKAPPQPRHRSASEPRSAPKTTTTLTTTQSTTTTPTATTPQQTSTRTTTSQTTTTPAPSPRRAAPAKPRARAHPPARPRRRAPAPAAPAAPAAPPDRGTVVTGRLISDVTPLAPDRSPLTAAAVAVSPQIRQATSGSSLPAVGVPLAVLGLLGLGAARELKGPARWRRR